ncbi:caspase family protein [Tautonia plasticadhaerens]|uniref:Caspase domain protein n=1 Tax=Tautonia plasticadhaerens TaxID=2527974 RepID=A0A518H982_9BACT|nr:caspase family protein [Tautonia plasticadhaerens]QDV37399.1 Caspase domain protein [Tautonia plasticadhaerens]
MADGVDNLHVLLIAVDFYKENLLPNGGFYPSLKGCVRDITLVEEFLTGRLKVPAERITKLSSTNTGKRDQVDPPEPKDRWPTYENMVAAFKALTERAQAGDQVYIHYSGHGSRSSSIFPVLKGSNGLDEGLVPLDIGDSEARYLRDLELARLLEDLVARQLVVTLVLDSCHSGGATREVGDETVAARCLQDAPFDPTPRPATSDVAPIAELIALARARAESRPAGTRNLDAGSKWVPDAKDYVLLAACQPNESAYEFAFDGKERNGALTYWLLEGLRNLRSGVTYQQLYNRIAAKVHTKFARQTPLLQGQASRAVLSSDLLDLQRAVTVTSVDPGRSEVVLNTGQAQGVGIGTRFAVFPAGTGDLSDDANRLAVVEVTQLGAVDSVCTIKESVQGARSIDAGDQAVLLDPASVQLCRKVALYPFHPDREPREPLPRAEADRLDALGRAIEEGGKGWVEFVDDGGAAEYQVAVVGGHFEIWDAAGEPVPNIRPAIAIDDPAGPDRVVRRLIHLSRYHSIIELENYDRSSPLRGKLVVELLRAPANFVPGQKPVPIPFEEPATVPTLRVGEGAFLRMRNESGVALNVATLDLRPGRGITRVFPGDAEFLQIDPGGEELMHLTASLPDGYDRGRDILKVFATVGPASYSWLELPSLDQPPRAATKGIPANPFEALMSAFAADRVTRDVIPTEYPSRNWTTAMVEVNITAKA